MSPQQALSACDQCEPHVPCRCLLLACEHGHAAAKAINSMQSVLTDLQQQLLRCAASNSSNTGSRSAGPISGSSAPVRVTTPQQPQQLLSCSAVLQLAHWHKCLESLDVAELPPPCWHDVFAHLLLTGALRAFGFCYQQVSLCHPVPWSSRSVCSA